MRDGLRLLEEQEQLYQIRLEALRAEIQKGLDSGDAGPWDIDDIKAEGRRLLAARKQNAA